MKDAHRTHRRFGEKKRWKELKKTDPMQKKTREVPDLIHLVDSWGRVIPKPIYTVLPASCQLGLLNWERGNWEEQTGLHRDERAPCRYGCAVE